MIPRKELQKCMLELNIYSKTAKYISDNLDFSGNILSFVKQFHLESVSQMMKKVISISLTFLLLIAVLHLSFATHYCGGTIAASKISLTGKLATCGMEDNVKDLPLTGLHLTTHCCDNILVCYGINSIFFPTFSFVQEPCQQHFQIFRIPANLPLTSIASIKSNCTILSPPGVSASNSVDLASICVFRI
jgi:hypothetical protein